MSAKINVDLNETLPTKVAGVIKAEGFEITLEVGSQVLNAERFGILEKPSKNRVVRSLKKFLNGRRTLALLDFKENGEWSLKLYGREHVEELRRLAERLSESFNIAIDIKVTKDYAPVFKPASEYC